ncbi:YdcF family protein [Pasteurellaceae bacterium 20609_3]|uniref:YdcF family protein n=1 Tax=Spirabiliibacterium mucosae TaxID=28156 RepID=UPI001AADB4A0|nr:YdcF family protein [Spirabiliibacterium mucosae]MBE2898130.1 YdcF family protein [Spirabiliibacterium mucosae]
MDIVLRKVLLNALLPPFNIILLLLFALLCYYLEWKWLARVSSMLGIGLLFLLSTPFVAHHLQKSLTAHLTLPTLEQFKQGDLIVVLGGGVRESDLGIHECTIGGMPLERMRFGAQLHKKTGLPLLVTGGSLFDCEAEADAMAREYHYYFNIQPKWIENKSHTTTENARLSREVLEKDGIKNPTIVLVTNDWHMQRAKFLFERQGFTVLPGMVNTQMELDSGVINYIPQASALTSSQQALKEWLGYWVLKLNIMK